jgi:hypothetical protein
MACFIERTIWCAIDMHAAYSHHFKLELKGLQAYILYRDYSNTDNYLQGMNPRNGMV